MLGQPGLLCFNKKPKEKRKQSSFILDELQDVEYNYLFTDELYHMNDNYTSWPVSWAVCYQLDTSYSPQGGGSFPEKMPL